MTALESILAEVRAELAARADPGLIATFQRFSREPIHAQGIRTGDVRKMAASLYKKVKPWPAPQRNRLCAELWRSGIDEEGNLAIYLYQRFGKQCAACEFHLFEKWIDRYVHNWSHCDGVAYFLIAASIANQPDLASLAAAWTASPNRWKRRAAAVSLVHQAKAGKSTALILKVAGELLADEDDLVRKGNGWLLKEAYDRKPGEVVRFLKARKKMAPRLVLRIAAEKMSAADRALILA